MKNEISIRRALESDADVLSRMICENATAMLAPHYTKEQWDVFITYYSPEIIRNKIGQQIVFCSEINGEIVGSVALDNDFVVGFYTRLEYLNQGIGAAMMSHLEAFALENNLKEIRLAASPVALKFYFKNGWEKVKDIIMNHYGVGFEETLMVKKLQ
jgi:GNAT superfamily N-acetyltransferase